MFKKIITSIVLASFIFGNIGIYFAKPTYAQESTWYYQEWPEWTERVYNIDNHDEIFGERYTAAQVEWVIYGLFSFIINHMLGDSSIAACIIKAQGDPVGVSAECIDAITNVINSISNNNAPNTNNASINPLQHIINDDRPISGIAYLKGAASKLNLVSEVKAQGFGFGAAESMRTLWVAVRNVTYFFLVLMIIAISFMIMFRFKISPQVVITVQSALPKIIITLILITFSYAIAGFMIDLLYVVIGLIAAVLSQSGLFVYSPLGGGGNLSWAHMYNNLAGLNFGQGIFGVMSFYFISFIIISLFALASNFLGFVNIFSGGTILIWVIIVVVTLIALLVILLKILWMLIKTFVTVLLLIAVGPIFIITGGFGGWLKTLASNLAVFAAIGPMLAVSFLFLGSALPNMGPLNIIRDLILANMPFNPAAEVFGSSGWIPPFLAMGGDMDLIWLFASFVVITLIPNVANIIKSRIQGRPFGYGTAVGAAIGVGAGTAWSPFGSQIAATRDAWAKGRGQAIYESVAGSKFGQKLKGVIGH